MHHGEERPRCEQALGNAYSEAVNDDGSKPRQFSIVHTIEAENMNDTITLNFSPKFVLWYRPSTGRVAWEPVAHCETEREAVHAVGCSGRTGGKWLVLPAGKEP